MSLRRVSLALVWAMVLVAPVQAEVYKYYDSNGNLVLTDIPPKESVKGAERIQTRPVMTIPALSPQAPASQPADDVAAKVTGYTIVIQNPADQSTYRKSEEEDIPVAFSVDPSLADGDQLEVSLDGGAIGNGSSLGVADLDRGEHVLKVVVKDAKGKVLASATSTFFVQHYSSLGPTAPKPKPKPKS